MLSHSKILSKYPWIAALPFLLLCGVFIIFNVNSRTVHTFTFIMFFCAFLYFFREWRRRKYYDEEEYLWYAVTLGVVTLVAAWTCIAENFHTYLPWAHRVPPLWTSLTDITALIIFFQTPNIVYKSWVNTNTRLKEFIEFADQNIKYRSDQQNEKAAQTFQKVIYAFFAIRNKDSELNSLVPLLNHSSDAVKEWAATLLLKSNSKYEEKCLKVLNELSKKEGYIGSAASKVINQWEEQKANSQKAK